MEVMKTYSQKQPIITYKPSVKLVPINSKNNFNVRESQLNNKTLEVDIFEDTFDRLATDVVTSSKKISNNNQKLTRKRSRSQDHEFMDHENEPLTSKRIRMKKKKITYESSDEEFDQNFQINEYLIENNKINNSKEKVKLKESIHEKKEISPFSVNEIKIKNCTINLESYKTEKNLTENDINDHFLTSTPRDHRLRLKGNVQNISPITLDNENKRNTRLSLAEDIEQNSGNNFSLKNHSSNDNRFVSSERIPEFVKPKYKLIKIKASQNCFKSTIFQSNVERKSCNVQNKIPLAKENANKNNAITSDSLKINTLSNKIRNKSIQDRTDLSEHFSVLQCDQSVNLTPLASKQKNANIVSFVESPLLFEDSYNDQNITLKNCSVLLDKVETSKNSILGLVENVQKTTETSIDFQSNNIIEVKPDKDNFRDSSNAKDNFSASKSDSSFSPHDWSNDCDSSYEYFTKKSNVEKRKTCYNESVQSNNSNTKNKLSVLLQNEIVDLSTDNNIKLENSKIISELNNLETSIGNIDEDIVHNIVFDQEGLTKHNTLNEFNLKTDEKANDFKEEFDIMNKKNVKTKSCNSNNNDQMCKNTSIPCNSEVFDTEKKTDHDKKINNVLNGKKLVLCISKLDGPLIHNQSSILSNVLKKKNKSAIKKSKNKKLNANKLKLIKKKLIKSKTIKNNDFVSLNKTQNVSIDMKDNLIEASIAEKNKKINEEFINKELYTSQLDNLNDENKISSKIITENNDTCNVIEIDVKNMKNTKNNFNIDKITEQSSKRILTENEVINFNRSEMNNSQELVDFLSKLNDPVTVTMRRKTYKKRDRSLAVITEDQVEQTFSVVKDKNDSNLLNRIKKSYVNIDNKKNFILEESEVDKSLNEQTIQPIFLKPGKSWVRSLSIINHFHSGQNMEKLAAGRSNNWRYSVQTILNMQSNVGIKQSNLNKNDDECNLHSVSISEFHQNEPNRKSSIITSPSRVSKRFSKRIIPSGKRSTLTDDFINSQRNSFITDRIRKTSIPRKTSLRIRRDTLIETEEDLIKSAKDIILRRCKQNSYIPFNICFPDSYIDQCRKIGEGVYGEVFLYEDDNEKSVIKIIPIEGDQLVNCEPQKKFHEILSEIIIAEELHKLRFGSEYNTNGFVGVKKIMCVVGKYPNKLVSLWKAYDKEKKSENDCPSMFGDQQLYIILDLAHGGQDLEAYVFQNASESLSIFLQTVFTLAVAEKSLEFEHRDLHWGNILISKTNDINAIYKLGSDEFSIPAKGVKVSVIDFTLSRMSYEGCKIFNDLATDPTLFAAQGEYQFDIYRMMRDSVNNDWQKFNPFTNVLWLDYILDKMITAARYKKKTTKVHKTAIQEMKKFRKEILNYESAYDIVKNCEKVTSMIRRTNGNCV